MTTQGRISDEGVITAATGQERGRSRPPRAAFLPFALPHITQAEIDEVVDTLRSGWIAAGPKVKRFEREFAEVIGAQHATALSSATAALHLALDAVGVGPGDEVIVPVYTFTSSAAVVVHCGARIVFADVDPATCNLDPAKLEALITPRTRAIVVVHIAGLPAEMDPSSPSPARTTCRSSRTPRTPSRRAIAAA